MRNTQTSAMAIGGHQYATRRAWRTTTGDTVLGKALSSKALPGERCRVRRRAPSFTLPSTGGSSMAQAGINVGPFDARAPQGAGALPPSAVRPPMVARAPATWRARASDGPAAMAACAMELPPVEGRVKDGARRCTRQRSPGNALLDNDLPRTVSPVVVRHARCVAYWCPSMAIADVWVFRIVHQDTGKPAQGVPVTVLDKGGNAAGHWVSDADGIVAVTRRDIPKPRLRVRLRNHDPTKLATTTPGDAATP